MRAGRGLHVGPVPGDAELVGVAPVLGPDGVGVGEDEAPDGLARARVLQVPEVAHEDALELGAVGAAVGLAALEQHAVLGQVRDGGRGDGVGLVEERRVARGLGELHQPAQHHPLVVRPRLHPVVLALLCQPVVDQVLVVDHPAVLEPVPLRLGDVRVVVFLGGHPVGEGRRHG